MVVADRFSKNEDPDGCPDQITGSCAYACVYCGRADPPQSVVGESAKGMALRAGQAVGEMFAFIAQLRAARQRRGMSHADVAEAVGVTEEEMQAFESGMSDPHLSTVRKYALAVGVRVRHEVTERSALQAAPLDALVERAEEALKHAAMAVEVFDLDLAGNRHLYEHNGDPTRHSALGRIIRCLRNNGLLDEGNAISLPALRALAQGEPLDEVADDYRVPLDVVQAAAPLIGR